MFSKYHRSPAARLWVFLLLLVSSPAAIAQVSYTIQPLETPPVASIRGMSVVSDSVVWVSGTGGKVGRTVDGGLHWQWMTVPGHDTADWRSIVAFSAKHALVLNAGEPAFVMRTIDGGATWKQAYYNDTKGIFFDAMVFSEGIVVAVGDPVDGRFAIIGSVDSGHEWKYGINNAPEAAEGEAIFAASGTSLHMSPGIAPCFVTGGSKSRFFSGERGTFTDLPLLQGSPSTGAFSLDFYDAAHGITVGGDYRNDTLASGNCALTADGGRTWTLPPAPPLGFRSCVQYISEKLLIATGTSGTDISEDGGLHWRNISRNGYHVAGVAPSGKKVWLAGARKIGMIIVSNQ